MWWLFCSGGAPDGAAVGDQDAGVARARGAGDGARHARRRAAAAPGAAARGARARQPPATAHLAPVPHALLPRMFYARIHQGSVNQAGAESNFRAPFWNHPLIS